MDGLVSSHEEADTRIILHCFHVCAIELTDILVNVENEQENDEIEFNDVELLNLDDEILRDDYS